MEVEMYLGHLELGFVISRIYEMFDPKFDSSSNSIGKISKIVDDDTALKSTSFFDAEKDDETRERDNRERGLVGVYRKQKGRQSMMSTRDDEPF